jgi:hypothetical protein
MKITAALIISLLVACGEQPESENRNQVAAKAPEKKSSNPLVSRTFEQRQKEEYEMQLEALRDSYLKGIEDLKANVQKQGAEAPEDLADTFAELEEKTQRVDAILKKLDAVGVESWQELKPDIHAALDQLEWSYYKAVAQVMELEEKQQGINRGAAPPTDVVRVKETP